MDTDAIITEVRAQLEALNSNLAEATSEERLKAIITPMLDGIVGDEDFQRKMRFGGTERKLVGSKYARHNMSVADLEFLYDMQESLTGQKRAGRSGVYTGPSEELKTAFGAVSDALYLTDEQVREIDKQALDNVFPRVPKVAFHGRDRALAEKGLWWMTGAYQNAIRAMDTAESGYGSQLIGAQYVGELWEAARQQSMVFSLFETFEMTAPTVYLPVEVDIPELLFVSESTANNSSNYDTVKTGSNRVAVTAKMFVIHQIWSGEMEEDSIIPFIPFLRKQATKSLAHYSDSLLINGDDTNAATGNINLDDADPADTKHYLAFDALRHVAIVDNTNNQVDHSGAAVTWDAAFDMREMLVDRTYLHDWSNPMDPNDLVYISMPEITHDLGKMDEVITVDKYGAAATVLTGEVAKIGRNPVVSSIAMALTMADGKSSTTAGNNTLGQLMICNKNGAVVGWRRRVKLETERLPATDQTRIVYSMRLGHGRFTPTGAASGIEWVATLFNIAV